MADTWITDITDFLENGRPARGLSGRAQAGRVFRKDRRGGDRRRARRSARRPLPPETGATPCSGEIEGYIDPRVERDPLGLSRLRRQRADLELGEHDVGPQRRLRGHAPLMSPNSSPYYFKSWSQSAAISTRIA